MSVPDIWPTVLIVEDDRLNRAMLAELLQDECRVLQAKDGATGLQILAREDVHLVLLDVSMPGMDGYEVLGRIRGNPATADVAVIFVTGMSETADEERGLLLGAADYVSKPIRPAIVRARVQAHLKLALQRRALERLALVDGLTGIANRRFFDDALERTVRQAARASLPLGLAMIDVDHFKQYNDRYGHGAGDEALKSVAGILRGFARRPGDVAARYGGEEFVLLLPEVQDFAALLEALRSAVAEAGIPHERSSAAAYLTISGGGLLARPAAGTPTQSLLEQADQLLYDAKRQGRNRFVLGEC